MRVMSEHLPDTSLTPAWIQGPVISFDVGPARFNYRVAGVVIHDGHVLLQTIDGFDFWFLPGGRCEANECSSATLAREMREECGEAVTVERLLWVAENFFTLNGRPFHELGFYYLTTLAP